LQEIKKGQRISSALPLKIKKFEMTKIKEKSWISPLLISFGGTFLGGVGLMVLNKVVGMTEVDWLTVSIYCCFSVSGILLLITLWHMYVSIKKHRQKLATEKLMHTVILMQLVKELQYKHGAKFTTIEEIFEFIVSPLAEELEISHSEARKLLAQSLAPYQFLRTPDNVDKL